MSEKFTKEMVETFADKLLIGLTPVAEESIPIEELLQNCKEYTGREVEVPKVVG